LPALRTIPFLHGDGLFRLRASPCWRRNELARTDDVLGYGHHGLPTAIVAGQRSGDLSTGRTTGRTDNMTDKVKT